jgi:hypothetical protein
MKRIAMRSNMALESVEAFAHRGDHLRFFKYGTERILQARAKQGGGTQRESCLLIEAARLVVERQ